MNTWTNTTPRNMTYSLLVASLFYLLFSLPMPPAFLEMPRLAPAYLSVVYPYLRLPIFLLTWFAYTNWWVMEKEPAPDNALMMVSGVTLGGLLTFVFCHILTFTFHSWLWGVLGFVLGIWGGGIIGLILGHLLHCLVSTGLSTLLSIALSGVVGFLILGTKGILWGLFVGLILCFAGSADEAKTTTSENLVSKEPQQMI